MHFNNEFNLKTQEFTSNILKENLSDKDKYISFDNHFELLNNHNHVDLFLKNNFKMPENVDIIWNRINNIDLKTLQSKDFFNDIEKR